MRWANQLCCFKELLYLRPTSFQKRFTATYIKCSGKWGAGSTRAGETSYTSSVWGVRTPCPGYWHYLRLYILIREIAAAAQPARGCGR